MNQRIKELIAQAREPLHNQNLPFNQGLIEYSEKFAELIVKECSKHAEHAKGIDVNFETYFKAMIFGVKE